MIIYTEGMVPKRWFHRLLTNKMRFFFIKSRNIEFRHYLSAALLTLLSACIYDRKRCENAEARVDMTIIRFGYYILYNSIIDTYKKGM